MVDFCSPHQIPKTSVINRTKVPIPSNNCDWVCFFGFGVEQQSYWPGETKLSGTNEHIARARNHHHLRHVYTHIAWQMVCADTKLLLVPQRRHGPCGEATPTRGRRRPKKSCDGVLEGADATSMTPPCVLPTTVACSRGCSKRCFVFAADASGQQKE